MRYQLKNRAKEWNGDALELEWCVAEWEGNPLSKWMSHSDAVGLRQMMIDRDILNAMIADKVAE